MLLPSATLLELSERGYAVYPRAMPDADLADLRRDADALEPLARQAGVGAGAERAVATAVRSSKCMPLYPPPPTSAGSVDTRMRLYAWVDRLRSQLTNEAELLSLPTLDPFSTELSLLFYPSGGFYARHLDVPAAADGWYLRHREGSRMQYSTKRTVSFILYLEEPAWEAAWGGQLRVWPREGDTEVVDVTPSGGTLVLFRSDQIEHEVLVTHRRRRCLVGWFKTSRWKNL